MWKDILKNRAMPARVFGDEQNVGLDQTDLKIRTNEFLSTPYKERCDNAKEELIKIMESMLTGAFSPMGASRSINDEIQLINDETSFIAKKSKTFDEEKNVAEKAPVDGIIINDLNENKTNKKDKKTKDITYSVKIADFYYRKSAEQMLNRIKEETKIKKYKIIKLSETNFRVILGPYNDIKTLEDSYNKATVLNFDNLEILRND